VWWTVIFLGADPVKVRDSKFSEPLLETAPASHTRTLAKGGTSSVIHHCFRFSSTKQGS
jgi:hypothetical protein